MTSEVKLKTGGDPRSLPDYAALRVSGSPEPY